MTPSDKREIDRLLDANHPDRVGGFWHDVFCYFDNEDGLPGDMAGRIAADCERAARRILEAYYS